jgi:hypothetical protein
MVPLVATAACRYQCDMRAARFGSIECWPDSTPEAMAAELSVAQRVLLFCVASSTDYGKVGITNASVQLAILRNLVQRDEQSSRLLLTLHGRAALTALLA